MSELDPAQLKDLAKQLNINTPILAHKVVGSRVELHLLGGVRVSTNLQDQPVDPDLANILAALRVKDLRLIASQLHLPNRSKMNKVELIKSLLAFPFIDIERVIIEYDLGS